jgi:hypothetical protein
MTVWEASILLCDLLVEGQEQLVVLRGDVTMLQLSQETLTLIVRAGSKRALIKNMSGDENEEGDWQEKNSVTVRKLK